MSFPPDRKIKSEPQVDLAALAVLDAQIDAKVVGEPKYDFDELSEASGWPVEQLAELCLWSGTPPAAPGERVYGDLDATGLIRLRKFAERENFDDETIGTLARSISYSMERLALTQVESIVNRLARSGLTDTAARVAAAEYAPTQSEAIFEQIGVLWRRHYAAAIHRLTTETILLRGVSDDDRQFPLIVGVGYAKVVDFTEHTANFSVIEYANFVQDFNNRAADIVNANGGRVVKLMGDTVVWVTAHADASAEIALQLSHMADDGVSAELQTAVTWCRVMSLHGDLFGPGVNLAAKLAELAPAGGVFIDDAAAGQFVRNPRFRITPQPGIEIKGLGKVRPWILQDATGTISDATLTVVPEPAILEVDA